MTLTGEILEHRVEPRPGTLGDEDERSDVSMDIADSEDFGAEHGESEAGGVPDLETEAEGDPAIEIHPGVESAARMAPVDGGDVPAADEGDVWAEAARLATAEAARRLDDAKERDALDALERVLSEVAGEDRPKVYWTNQYAGAEDELMQGPAAFSVGSGGAWREAVAYFAYFAYLFGAVLGGEGT
jgi:hypothetical protein